MKKRFRYLTYILAGIAIFSALLITKDKIAEAANRVYLNETNLTLELGRYRTLKVYGASQSPIFKSANKKAATVTTKGKITAQGWGSTTIYTYVGNKTLKTKVTVVQMNKKNLTLTPGNISALTLWGANNNTTWKSSNTKVATVSENGVVTAIANGSATITATFNGKKVTSEISVVGLNHESKVLEYGGRFSLTSPNNGYVVNLKVDGTKDKVTWSSNNAKVATVDSKGKVTARGPGNTKITATVNGSKITTDIKVLQMEISLLELSKDQTFKLNVLGTNNDINWKTFNHTFVTVDNEGLVTGVGPGTTKVAAEVDGRRIRCIITVK